MTCADLFCETIKAILVQQYCFSLINLLQLHNLYIANKMQANNIPPRQFRQPPRQDSTSNAFTCNPFPADSNSQKTLFKHVQKHLFLIAYNRGKDEIPLEEIMVLQQPHKKIKLANEAQQLTKMFHNVGLQSTETEQLFLTRVNATERQYIQQQIKQNISRGESFSSHDRQQRRKMLFQSSSVRKLMDRASEEVIAKRKIRIVKLDSFSQAKSVKGVIELGGKTVEYEDLNINDETQNYYTLVRRKVKTDEAYPRVTIDNNLLAPIDFEVEQDIDEEANDDDYDSNNSDNPDYDYPEEQYSSKSSEGIIRGRQEDDYSEKEGDSEDEEQLYRRYLRRCKAKEQEIDGEYPYEQYD